jgi:broad specificity phosphatase PhoE
MNEIWVVRHGQTEWSLSGQHTGWTDLPLTDVGRAEAAAVGRYLDGRKFTRVLVSPLQRARETCRIAGYDAVAEVDPDLREWCYGAYEGRTAAEIRDRRPGWSLWDDGVEAGESIEDVAARARRVIARVETVDGDVLLFAHGHLLRILTACWIGLPPNAARLFSLGTASFGVLGHEREWRAMTRWNLPATTEPRP